MMLKFVFFLAALQPAAAQFGLSGMGSSDSGSGSNSDSGSSSSDGNGNSGSSGGGVTIEAAVATTGVTTTIPLTQSFIRSITGIEDPRAENDAELLRNSPPRYPDNGIGASGTNPITMVTEPNARGVSNLVANPLTLATAPGKSRASDMLWQWGQFMDHDIGLTEGHDEEFTIVSPDCLNGDLICTIAFQRAIHHFDDNGVRQQLNEITGFLDASMVYGHTELRANALRDSSGGRLLMTADGLMPPLPAGFLEAATAAGELINANPGFPDDDFFFGGDVRVNEQVGLIGIHTLWVREHNRVAALLARAFPSATDEQLYQMARKIITAEIQAITYKEFLPILIGSSAPDLAAYNGFDSSVNPGINTEFSTVAFRVGHTFLSGNLLLHDGTNTVGSISLMNAFFDPTLFHNNTIVLDEVLIGQSIQAANAADTKVIPEVRDFLFGHPVGGAGLDLVALNIQRAHDNGVALYNDMRASYGLERKQTFLEVTGGNQEIANELASAYPGGVNQCDPWICGLAEPAFGGGEVGELFSTVIGDQYQRLMDGDEFFYLNDADLFTQEILDIIDVNTRTLTDVLNDNTSASGLTGFAMLVDKTATSVL